MQDRDWLKPRKYDHFDRPQVHAYLRACIPSPEHIVSHSFLPFIRYVRRTPRYHRDEHKCRPKERLIAYAAHMDSQIYAYYAHVLGSLYESRLEELGLGACVLAYRRFEGGRSNIDFAKEAFDRIRDSGECDVIAIDIAGYFDNIDHRQLKQQWCRLLGVEGLPKDHYVVYKAITRYAFVEREALRTAFPEYANRARRTGVPHRICSPREFRQAVRAQGLVQVNAGHKGIPQGSPISALLSNIYLLDFDRSVQRFAAKAGGIYRRYCDDILVVVPPGCAGCLVCFLESELSWVGLEPAEGKTEIREFRLGSGGHPLVKQPLEYLGFSFDGMRILVRPSTVSRFLGRMKRAVRATVRHAPRTHGVVPKAKLYRSYSHLGQRNYPRYVLRAAARTGSSAIRRQHRRMWRHLSRALGACQRRGR